MSANHSGGAAEAGLSERTNGKNVRRRLYEAKVSSGSRLQAITSCPPMEAPPHCTSLHAGTLQGGRELLIHGHPSIPLPGEVTRSMSCFSGDQPVGVCSTGTGHPGPALSAHGHPDGYSIAEWIHDGGEESCEIAARGDPAMSIYLAIFPV